MSLRFRAHWASRIGRNRRGACDAWDSGDAPLPLPIATNDTHYPQPLPHLPTPSRGIKERLLVIGHMGVRSCLSGPVWRCSSASSWSPISSDYTNSAIKEFVCHFWHGLLVDTDNRGSCWCWEALRRFDGFQCCLECWIAFGLVTLKILCVMGYLLLVQSGLIEAGNCMCCDWESLMLGYWFIISLWIFVVPGYWRQWLNCHIHDTIVRKNTVVHF